MSGEQLIEENEGILVAALEYLERGWSIIPVRVSGEDKKSHSSDGESSKSGPQQKKKSENGFPYGPTPD